MRSFLFPEAATRNKICYETEGKAISAGFPDSFSSSFRERASLWQNILLLLYTLLLLLQFLMKPLVTSAKIWTKALLGILNQNVYHEMQSLNCT